MHSIQQFFNTSKPQKVLGIILVLIILAAIPATLYQVHNKQIFHPNAANIGPRTYPCGGFTISLHTVETPDCTNSSGTISHLGSYQVSNLISGAPTGYTLKYNWAKWFCPTENASAPCDANASGSNEILQSSSATFDANGSAWAVAAARGPTGSFTSCGYYQFDFDFQVLNTSGAVVCSWPGMYPSDPTNSNSDYSFCHSGTTCQVVNTPTPTLTPPVDTPTDTPTPPTDTPTPGVTVTDTPTPGLTITPTDTPGPGPSDTPTPTGNPTTTPTTPNQPTVTPTVFIAINSPKPTLPPTGPGNTFIAVGFVGVAIAVLGLALALAI